MPPDDSSLNFNDSSSTSSSSDDEIIIEAAKNYMVVLESLRATVNREGSTSTSTSTASDSDSDSHSASDSAPVVMEFNSPDVGLWREALLSYSSALQSLAKPNLISLDDFYRNELPNLLRQRHPDPYITTAELSRLMEWKLARGKWRPRLLSFVSSLNDAVVRDASSKAFAALPDVSKAVSELTVLKGVGPATASAVLAAFAPDVAPFMSDEAMVAALGDSKDYSLKRYMVFVEKMQAKAKELSSPEEIFTPSDVERALWSHSVGAKLKASSTKADSESEEVQSVYRKNSKRKRKR